MPPWPVKLCGWVSENGHRCTLREGHRPLVFWPHHAPTPLPHLGDLQDRQHGGKRL